MDEHKINRAALCVLAVYGPQKVGCHRAWDEEELCFARLATWEPVTITHRRYTITDAGRAYLERTRPAEREVLERRLEGARRDGDVRTEQAANNELLEWDRAAASMKAREAAKKGDDALTP